MSENSAGQPSQSKLAPDWVPGLCSDRRLCDHRRRRCGMVFEATRSQAVRGDEAAGLEAAAAAARAGIVESAAAGTYAVAREALRALAGGRCTGMIETDCGRHPFPRPATTVVGRTLVDVRAARGSDVAVAGRT